MASNEYIAAAEQENRQPVVFMSIDGSEAGAQYYTTQTDWEGSDDLTNVNTDVEPGSVVSTFELSPSSITAYPATSFAYFIRSLSTTTLDFTSSGSKTFGVGDDLPPGGTEVLVTFNYSMYLTFDDGVNQYDTDTGFYAATIEGEVISIVDRTVSWAAVGSKSAETTIPFFFEESGAAITVTANIVVQSVTAVIVGFGNSPVDAASIAVGALPVATNVPISSTNCQVETSAIDMGSVLTGTPIISIDDISESGSSIAYTYTYSADDISYTSGGTIVDGSQVTPSRYYKVTGLFSSTDGDISRIREFRVSEGIFKYFGTHIDEPFTGISPYIVPDSVSTLNQKIQIGKGLSSTGESTVKLFWTAETGDMIAAGYLRGKDVTVYSGFVGLPEEAYEQVITGTWYDHDLDERGRKISVKIRDALKQLSQKRKLPEEVVNNSTGEITTSPIVYDTENLITTTLDQFDKVGLRDRYIHPDWAILEAGKYNVNKYLVSRTITKPTEVNKLIDQLCVTGSMYVIPLGNGQLKPKPFDVNQEHIATLDADSVDFSGLKANLKDFFSRFYAYYNPNVDPPTGTEDFDNGYGEIDATAELKWFPEKGTKEHLDLWKVGRTVAATPLTTPPQALIDLMKLWQSLFVEPLYTVNVDNLPPRFANIEPADVVEVNGLDLPVVTDQWGGEASYDNVFFDTGATTPTGIFFRPDGLKMYMATTSTIFQFSVGKAWCIDEAVYDNISFSTAGEDTGVTGVFFNVDGDRMYTVGITGDAVYQYDLSTPWDVSTSVYNSISLSVASEETAPQDLYFSFDGSVMYIIGPVTGAVYQYTLTTSWDLNTASYASKSKTISTEDIAPISLFFKADGTKMYFGGSTGSAVYQYSLATAWDLATASYDNDKVNLGTEPAAPTGLTFRTDGTRMIVMSGAETNKGAYQYSVLSAWQIGGEPYSEGDRVIHDGKMWRSRVSDNLDNDPTSEPAFWQDININSDGKTNEKHFFVIGRTFNPNNATINLNLMEMPPATLGAFAALEFSSAFDV